MMKEVEEGKLPIYFHCMTGKDRTGVAAIILLLALGVKKEEILKLIEQDEFVPYDKSLIELLFHFRLRRSSHTINEMIRK